MRANLVNHLYVCECCKHNGLEKIKKCGNCKLVYYCSVNCQKNDWLEHKKVCYSNKPLNDIKLLIRRWESNKDAMYFKIFDRYDEFYGCKLMIKNQKLFLQGIADNSFTISTNDQLMTNTMVTASVGNASDESNVIYRLMYFKDQGLMISLIKRMQRDMNMYLDDVYEDHRKYMLFSVADTAYRTFWAD